MADAPALRIQLNPQPSRTPVTVSSHADRDRVQEVFRDALSKPGHPSQFAVQAMQDAVKPQKQTVLVQDENQLLENGLRTLLQELVAAAVEARERVMQHGESIAEGENDRGLIPRLLDIVLYLCERGHVEGGMIFQLLEDLTEMSTMKDCKEVFGYIESKQDVLGKQELFGRGKLVMLRTCNQLLRRLSKANDVVFCGRILMFLAHFFPLSERSALNIKGIFNTSNETKYEKEHPPDGISIDFNFYKTFWSLQEYFCNPAPMLHALSKWQSFAASLSTVLDTFEAQPLGDDDANADDLEERDTEAFSIKYLTSSKLMSLELKDPSFRRHILVQCLIIFDYLKSAGKGDKDGPKESMREEIKDYEERVKKLLEIIPPRGREFLDSIEHILKREQNWVWWKRDGCIAFEKPVPERKMAQDGIKKRRPRWRLGNKELSQLWKWAEQNPNALTDPQRVRMPSVIDYWKSLAEDMDPAAGIEAEYHHKNNRVYCWKGLRFSARQDLEGFSRYTEHGIEGVIPPELLAPEVRVKYHGKTTEKSKRGAKKEEETKGTSTQTEEIQANGTVAELDDGGATQEIEDAPTPMDTDAPTATQSGDPTPDESQKQSSDIEAGAEAVHSEGGNSSNPTSADLEEGLMRDSSPQDTAVLSNEGSSPKVAEHKPNPRKRPQSDS
uniref:TSA: Wollemia nobilis Ref_Wollemi_Transcript_9715_2293 transcribed RNA sequence n=1 Tax=Wollemia nobilis TaxID=56998 RepID=A0A0C9QU23_9CONI